MSFSNSGGGTLALPSPTHAHNIDVTSGLRTLRRSLSRSPSKFNLTRPTSHNTQSPQNSQPGSPQSPCRRYRSTPLHQIQQLHLISQPKSAPPSALTHNSQDSQTVTPLRPNIRLSLRSAKAKTASPSRPLARARASPKSPITKSPLRRALNTAPDSVNSAQRAFLLSMTSPHSSTGQENYRSSPLSPLADSFDSKLSRQSLSLDGACNSQNSFVKALDVKEQSQASSTGSLKRSDATMNLDQQNQGSPMPKRRSLGIIEPPAPPPSHSSTPLNFDIHEDTAMHAEFAQEGVSLNQRDSLSSPTPSSHVHRRTSSLRKSTLQQRYGDKSSLGLGRRTGERQLANMAGSDLFTPSKNRPRVSTDHFFPPPAPRDGPFTCMTPVSNVLTNHTNQVEKNPHNPHPLSKTLTTSSSGNSLTEEQTFYAPAPKPNPFTQSLPLNAIRPTAKPHGNDQYKTIASTPNQGSHLWPGAFNSTGLVSKVNRNLVDDEQKLAPPDTPCKKHTNQFATFPPPSGSAKKKMKIYSGRNSFGGMANTLFNAKSDTFGGQSKGMRDIFGRSPAVRKTSFKLFQEVDDFNCFGDDSGASNPATPTKNATPTPSISNLSERSNGNSMESPSANRTIFIHPTSAVRAPLSRQSTCKYAPGIPGSAKDVDYRTKTVASRNPKLRDHQFLKPPLPPYSGGQPRPQRGPMAPFRPGRCHNGQFFSGPSNRAIAKICHDPASPVGGQRTPQTPQGRLSTLAFGVNPVVLSMSPADGNMSDVNMRAPVTPTSRGGDFRSSTSSIFVTPVNARSISIDIDTSLTSRFIKADQIGKGEFSTVYRCEKGDILESTTPGQVFSSPQKNAVYAVKKSRYPYTGSRDRQTKIREVEILSQLTHCDHVVMYVDHWEYQDRLYIQTEYCEEGTLEKFFGTVGNGGRLDDFRIYKILQDLCLGLKEIHVAGFMHLDIKPANILINFEGSLKIADFGLAQPINRKKEDGNDVEGDREYMAPELLKGRAGPSSDIFSLGLMILEAAANVVLPPNGPSWQMLRSGDLSEVPSLTWTPSSGFHEDATSLNYNLDTPTRLHQRSELEEAPDFMTNSEHECSLDSIVRRMTAECEQDRPSPDEILNLEGLCWVVDRRTAPATVFEGHWGPARATPTLAQNPFQSIGNPACGGFSPFTPNHFISLDDEDTVMMDV